MMKRLMQKSYLNPWYRGTGMFPKKRRAESLGITVTLAECSRYSVWFRDRRLPQREQCHARYLRVKLPHLTSYCDAPSATALHLCLSDWLDQVHDCCSSGGSQNMCLWIFSLLHHVVGLKNLLWGVFGSVS